ncbi:G-protein coupled receptor 78 isoform X2 [Phyllobates terribilis]|uniref:G-protein coupled receptor 78 isoform X2 n=1 Tax=Phyllobates terribilis TaxID=111132 RepID=UPI003CCB3FC4
MDCCGFPLKLHQQDEVLKVARFHCRRIDIITMQTLVLLVDIHPSVKQRCLSEQKRRRQRATKKISIFIGSFVVCFAPYVITRLIELLPYVKINSYWGIVSKCLAYSKAAADPFVYSLLRQQYKKVLLNIINRILKRELYPSSGYNSSLDTENDYCLHRAS